MGEPLPGPSAIPATSASADRVGGCPRHLGGQLFRDQDGFSACLQCGWVGYPPVIDPDIREWREGRANLGRCYIPGCEEGAVRLGLCSLHMMRKRRHGSPYWVPPPRKAGGSVEGRAKWKAANVLYFVKDEVGVGNSEPT